MHPRGREPNLLHGGVASDVTGGRRLARAVVSARAASVCGNSGAWQGVGKEDEGMRMEELMPARGGGHQLMSPVGARSSCRSLLPRGWADGRASHGAMQCLCRASGGRWGALESLAPPPAVLSRCHPGGRCVGGSGGVSLGGWTAPGDGANGDAAAPRGWRRGRSRRVR